MQALALQRARKIALEVSVTSRGNASGSITAETLTDETAEKHTIGPLLASVSDQEAAGTRRLTARAHVSGTSEHWRTAAALLEAGDRLELSLAVDVGNTYLREARLHSDRICLRIHKPDGRTYAFPLVNGIAPDNYARLVQR